MGGAPLVGGTRARRSGLRRQYLFFAAVCLLAVAFTALVAPSSASCFERFYGSVQPLVVMVVAGVVGAVALWVLTRFGFVIVEGGADA